MGWPVVANCKDWSDHHRELGWEAATERFIAAAEIGPKEWPGLVTELLEGSLWGIYRTFTGRMFTHPPGMVVWALNSLLVHVFALFG